MDAKHIAIIIVILLILSSIPFLFGKHLGKNINVNQESQSIQNENSQSTLTSETKPTTDEGTTITPSTTPNPIKITTPAPTPTPPPAPAPTPLPPPPVSITISQFSFQQSNVTIKRGAKITWTNQDSVPHTVTSDSSSVFDSNTLTTGNNFSFMFNTVGSFSYHCAFHPSMRATVIVTE